jgi:hypothetical protein
MTTWIIRFTSNEGGLTVGEIAELEGLVTSMGYEATISTEYPCRHEHCEMLARVDESTVGATGTDLPLSWSPICRNCGADVPAQNEAA